MLEEEVEDVPKEEMNDGDLDSDNPDAEPDEALQSSSKIKVNDFAGKANVGDHSMQDSQKDMPVNETAFVPVDLARNQIRKMETDMKLMQERHLLLMTDLDVSYQVIETETQEHFVEFLNQWKDVATTKISQHKEAFKELKGDKEDIQNKTKYIIGDLEGKNEGLIKDYERLLKKYREDLDNMQEENEHLVTQMRGTYEEELAKLRQERIELKDLLEKSTVQRGILISKSKNLKSTFRTREDRKIEEMDSMLGNYVEDTVRSVLENLCLRVEADHYHSQAEDKLEKYEKNTALLGTQVMGFQKAEEKRLREYKATGAAKQEDKEKYKELKVKQSDIKGEINEWKRDFESKNGRASEKKDKKKIENIYLEYKSVNEEIRRLKAKIDETNVNDEVLTISSGRSTPREEVVGGGALILGGDFEEEKALGDEGAAPGQKTPAEGMQMVNSKEYRKLIRENERLHKEKEKLVMEKDTPGDQKVDDTKIRIMELEDEVAKLKEENKDLDEKLNLANLKIKTQGLSESEGIVVLNAEVERLTKENEDLKKGKKQWFKQKKGRGTVDDFDELEKVRKERDMYKESYEEQKRKLALGLAVVADKDEDSLKQELRKAAIEIDDLNKQIAELEDFPTKVATLEGKVEEQQIKIDELLKDNNALSNENIDLTEQCKRTSDLEIELQSLKVALASETKDEEAKALLLQTTEEKNQLDKRLIQREKKIQKLEKKLVDAEKASNTAKELRRKNTVLERDIEEYTDQTARIEELESEVEILRGQLTEGISDAVVKEELVRITAENIKLKEKLAKLKNSAGTIKELRDKYEMKTNELTAARLDIKKLEGERTEMQKKSQQVEKLEDELRVLRADLAGKPGDKSGGKEVVALKRELKKTVNENTEMNNKLKSSEQVRVQLAQAKAQNESLSTELLQVRQELRKTEVERDRLKPKAEAVNKTKAELNQMRAKLAAAGGGGAAAGAAATGDKGQIKELVKENAKLRLAAEQGQKTATELKAKNERIKELEGKLREAKGELKNQDKAGKGEESKLRMEVDKQKAEIRDLEKQLAQERANMKALKAETDKNKSSMAKTKEKDITALNEKVKQLEESHRKELAYIDKKKAEDTEKGGLALAMVKTDLKKSKEKEASLTEKTKELEKQNGKLSKENDKMGKELGDLRIAAEESVVLQEKNYKMAEEMKKISSDMVIMETKYREEVIQRKKLHNMIEDLKGKIRVYCRVRPLSDTELEKRCESVVSIPDEFTINIEAKQGLKQFNFDHCFGEDSTQLEVYDESKRLIQSAVDGFNVCIFAYGQTGSGKTYTIQGPDNSMGIAPRGVHELFAIVKSMTNFRVSMELYMVELYLDQLKDLLLTKEGRKDPPHLDIKQELNGMVRIQNARIIPISNAEQTLKIFGGGLEHRKTSSTAMNDTSSRSHLVFSIIIDSTNRQTGVTNKGKLSFVDLAGSERVSKSGATAERLKEGRAINKSLSALGDVISILSEDKPGAYIPYRNNKLTMLMKDSIGGNAKTLMFVNISPADYNCDETVTSLMFATRIKKITNESSKMTETREIKKMRENYNKMIVKMDEMASKLRENRIPVPGEEDQPFEAIKNEEEDDDIPDDGDITPPPE